MSSDLIFSILPREGKVPMSDNAHKVQQVSKEANLRKLNDEEKSTNAEERDAREKHQKDKKRRAGQDADVLTDSDSNADIHSDITDDDLDDNAQGHHLDTYA